MWSLGAKRFTNKTKNLDWFATEYEKAWGRKPLWQKYWKKNEEQGFLALKRDYEVVTPVNFSQFQACFNLLIALFGIEPHDVEILHHVMQSQKEQGLLYSELRTIIPPRFNEEEASEYLKNICSEVLKFSSPHETEYQTKLILSLPRANELLNSQYTFLKSWMKKYQELSAAIVGIDFCFIEEGHPPEDKKEFCARVHQDNEQDPTTALAILYHVGESFQNMSLMSSIRWVCEAWHMGAHRLGHAISLGVDPAMYLHHAWHEGMTERQSHLQWLLKSKNWLSQFGYDVDKNSIRKELNTLASSATEISGSYNETMVKDIRSLQDAVLKHLKEKKALIESCPTSNLRIGDIKELKFHPLQRFLSNGMDVIISSDDPGIFSSNLHEEFLFCSHKLAISNDELDQCRNRAIRARSQKLVRG